MIDIQLENHPFILMNFEDIKPLVKDNAENINKRVQETGEIRSKSPMELAPKEYYCMSVFERSIHLIDGFELLDYSLKFLNRFPSPKTYERQGINRFNWLEYHFSYYVITFVSLYDISLILVNSVFRLGIPDRNCNNSNIRKNSWIKDSKTEKNLKELDKIIQPYRHPRNLHVHRGDLPDIKEKADYDTLDLIHLVEFINHSSEPIIKKEILQNAYDGQTFLLIRNLSKEIMNAQIIVSNLLTDLIPIYEDKRSNLVSDY